MKNISLDNIKLDHVQSNFYGNVDGLSLQNLFYARHGEFPSCYLFASNTRTRSNWTFNTSKILEYINGETQFGTPNVVQYYTKMFDQDKENKSSMAFCAIFPDCDLYMRIDKCPEDSYILFHNKNTDKAHEMVAILESFYEAPEKLYDTYFRLASRQSGYYLETGKIKAPENFSVEKQYNDSFIKEHNKIMSFIDNEEKSGLVMLHGLKGTGKSTYIKHLVASNPDKKFVYIPANLINMLADPSFGSFLTTLNNHIIVLEDCENVIRDRQTSQGMASAVSLLLNMTDGILSDDLCIKFICTFNEDVKNIDTALLRKGRMISKYEFTNLDVDKANALLEELGVETKTNKPMSLAEIFHYEDDNYDIKKKSII
jgi:hypothetical protein